MPARLGRADRRRQPWLRHPAIRRIARFQDLGDRGAAEGDDLQLPAARRRAGGDPVFGVADQDRQPDLRAGDRAEDDRPMHPAGKNDRAGDGLGGV